MGGPAGPCGCWPTGWSSWRWSSPSRARRCGGRCKKRTETAPTPAGGPPPPASRRAPRRHQGRRGPVVCGAGWGGGGCAGWRLPVAVARGRPARYDYEYRREGVANLFLIFEPLLAWRAVQVTARRTAVDFAEILRWLVED